MARRGLGGSGDWSGTFASLYSFNRNESKARQAAEDQDAADRWANGLMSDDEWLAYIRTAIERESGDPKAQQKWTTALRKYSTLIADRQAEQEYESGGSINQLIAHYEQRLGGMVKDSNEYRETQLRLNDLLDQRSGEKLTDDAEKMVDEINAGRKSYADLKKLLQDGLATARNNSDLKKSIEKQIDQVNETMRVNAVEGSFEKLQYEYDAGKLSAGSYAKKLRQMAVQFKDNDPKRYYQILEAAVALDKSGGRSGGGGGGGGGGGRSGGGGGSSKKSINLSIDALQAKRNSAQALLEQFEAGARQGVDPNTGRLVVFNPGVVRELDETVVRTNDQLTAAYQAKGDLSAAMNAQKSKAYFIANNVVAHNTLAVDDQRRELMASTGKVLEGALSNPDPTSGMNGVRFVAEQWRKFSTGLTQQSVKSSNFGGDVKRRLPAESGETVFTGPKGLMDQVDPDLVASSSTFAQALGVLAQPGVDDATAESALMSLYGITGKFSGSTGDPSSNPFVALAGRALEVNARQQGLATGDLVRIATPGGLAWARTTEVSYTAPDPSGNAAVQVTKKVATEYRTPSGEWKPLEVDGKRTKMVDIFMDINGSPTKVQAIATLTSPQGFDGWVADETKIVNGVQLVKGQAITDSQMTKILGRGNSLEGLAKAGVITSAPLLSQWTVTTPGYTDKSGKKHGAQTWNQDAETGMWYLGALPIRGVQRDASGMVRFGDNGPLIDWKAYGSAWGVPAPYAGDDPKAMQDRLNNGEVDVSSISGRDLLGRPTDEPAGINGAYWDPRIDGLVNLGKSVVKMFTDDDDDARGWWDDSRRSQRASELKTAAERDVELRRKPSADPDDDDEGGLFGTILNAGLKAVSKSLGLSLEGTKPRPTTLKSAALSQVEKNKRRGSGLAELDKKLDKGSSPIVTLPEVKKQTFSGPAIKTGMGDLGLAPRSTQSAPKIKPPPKKTTTQKPPAKKKTSTYKPPVVKPPTIKTQTTQKRAGGYLD